MVFTEQKLEISLVCNIGIFICHGCEDNKKMSNNKDF